MAEPTAAQRDLIDSLRYVLSNYGLESMTDWIVSAVVSGKDELTIITDLRKTPQYKARFPAMAELQKNAAAGTGIAITEGDYIAQERAYRQAFAFSGLPPQMWDSPDDFAKLMTADVSPTEVQRRIAAAKEAVDNTDPNTRSALLEMYGITAHDLMAYALDPKRGADYIQKIATSGILAGYARSAGFGNMSTSQWESYAQDLINQQIGDDELRGIISGADILAGTQSRLAGIEGDQFTTSDAMDVAIRKDSDKIMASERRVAREKARFSKTSGVTTGTLKGSGI